MPDGPAIANCSVTRVMDVILDPWTFLVLREAWFGRHRFEQFRRALGLPRGTLSNRLAHLVAEGLLQRVRYQDRPPRYEYRLTRKGGDLYPSMAAMLGWGDRWLAGDAGPPLVLLHEPCGHVCTPEVLCSQCRRAIDIQDVSYHPGPGAGIERRDPSRRMHRSPRPENFVRQRACSVARTLSIVGDRWTFLLLREAWFGVHRFDAVRRNLGIATNILSDRLQRVVANGILERRLYATGPARFEYRLTERGRDLYLSMITLMRWGDRWLAGGAGPPLVLRHAACGHDFHAVVACNHCRREIRMHEMRYSNGPGWRVERGAGSLEAKKSRSNGSDQS